MELVIGIIVVAFLIVVFVVLQLIGILFLMDENKKIAEELEKSQPPFQVCWAYQKTVDQFYNNQITLSSLL